MSKVKATGISYGICLNILFGIYLNIEDVLIKLINIKNVLQVVKYRYKNLVSKQEEI